MSTSQESAVIVDVNEVPVGSKNVPISFSVDKQFTLLETGRENFATSLALIMAGRMNPAAGSVTLFDASGTSHTKPRDRRKRVALAGVTDIDSLERLVPIEVVIREQIAWASPWYSIVPRDVLNHPKFTPWAELLDLELEPKKKVGELKPVQRFLLRIVLGLIARPDADLLIVDDVDQIRSMELRAQLLRQLRQLAETLPVIVLSSNPDVDGICEDSINVQALKEGVEAYD